MTRLLITRHLPPTVLAAARARFDVDLRSDESGLTPDQAAKALQDYDAILCTLGDRFVASTFTAVPRCKILANFGVGYNHIDVGAAAKAGVTVTNTPDVVTDATADIAMALILSCCRRTGEGERLVRANRWDGWQPMQMLGTHVTGKTVGIIGMGRIGQAVARRCHYGFDMPVRYFSRQAKDPGFSAQRDMTLPALMGNSDIVVITVPGGATTSGMIGADELAAMRKTGILINVARGDVVREDALIAALQSGAIAGTGLDVYAAEPQVPPALRSMENVVLLPHLGTAALEIREAMGMMALDNVVAWANGQPPPQAL